MMRERVDGSVSRPFSIITVVFEGELELLKLQGVSLRRYLGRGLEVAEILLIINGSRQARLEERIRHEVAPAYGHLAPLLRIMRGSDLLPESEHEDGWHTQQVLKLQAAALVVAPAYLVLDAKNHLIRSLVESDLFAKDGRLKYMRGDNSGMRAYFTASMEATGAIDHPSPDDAMLCITPAVLDAEIARSLLAEMERRGVPLLSLILRENPHACVEFFLYLGHGLKLGTFDTRHVPSDSIVRTLWHHHTSDRFRFEEVITSASADPKVKFFSVHRHALKQMAPWQGRQIARFLVERGLFAKDAHARAWLGKAGLEAQRPIAARIVNRLKKLLVGVGHRLKIRRS